MIKVSSTQKVDSADRIEKMSVDEDDVCDLSVVLAPLSKDQLEILIVKLIGRNEEIGDDVMRTAPKAQEYLHHTLCLLPSTATGFPERSERERKRWIDG
jgi:hypothetical protein